MGEGIGRRKEEMVYQWEDALIVVVVSVSLSTGQLSIPRRSSCDHRQSISRERRKDVQKRIIYAK